MQLAWPEVGLACASAVCGRNARRACLRQAWTSTGGSHRRAWSTTNQAPLHNGADRATRHP